MTLRLSSIPNSQGERQLAERLERGEVLYYPSCPFALPEGDDRLFLFEQQLAGRVHKNIGFDPNTGKTSGFRRQSAAQAERLRSLLADFAHEATSWLGSVLPAYADCWQLDRVSYRPEEEAGRRLRLTARNDLLHVDAFPSRPTGGARILRVFANINRTEPRIWITSSPFAELLRRYGKEAGLPTDDKPSWSERLHSVMQLFRPGKARRSVYDSFMLRFHNYLKANKEFQRQTPRRWEFPPGSAWVVMTDTCSHAALKGRYALEHSYFVPVESLALPKESPIALLKSSSGTEVQRQAA